MDRSNQDHYDRCRPDGGVTDASQTPDGESPIPQPSPGDIAAGAAHLESIVQLLTNPALARTFVYICYWGPTTPPEVIDELELSKATAYNYVDTLVKRNLVNRDESTHPQLLTSSPVAVIDPEHAVYITPTVFHAIALQEIDEDVAYFTDRYGVGRLIAALRGTGLHFAGKSTQRMVANDIDVQQFEGMMIVNALTPALGMGKHHDPYFDRLFPDVHDEIELPSDVEKAVLGETE